MKVKTTYTKSPIFKPNTEYKVVKYIPQTPEAAYVLDDDGEECLIILDKDTGCAYLNDEGEWEVIEEYEKEDFIRYITQK